MISSISTVVKSVSMSLASSELKRFEDSVRAGGDNRGTAIRQCLEGFYALQYINKSYKEANRPGLSLLSKCVICLTPALLAIFKDSKYTSSKINRALKFCQNNIGNLYQVAAVVSSVSLLFFGHQLFAVCSLTILGIGFLDRNGLLPQKFRQFLHRYNTPVWTATAVVSGGFLDKILAAFCIFSWCVNALVSSKKQQAKGFKQQAKGFTVQQNLTFQQARDFLDRAPKIKINREYVKYHPMPPIPEIDIQMFLEKFEQIDWNRHLHVLREKLRHDARFIERHKNPELKSDQEIIEYTRHCLAKLVEDTKNQRILEGEPADYEKLHNFLKLIGKYLQDENDEVITTDILFRLAVEGGEYCGPGKFEVAESVFLQIVDNNNDVPLHDKIIYVLEQGRHKCFDVVYDDLFKCFADFKLLKFIDLQDVHIHNVALNMYGEELGLMKSGADNDAVAHLDPFTKFYLHKTNRNFFEQFWSLYDFEAHAYILIPAIGTNRIPKPEVYNFWLQWIERQQIDEVKKEELREELGNGMLFGRPLEINQKFTREFVALMLIDMGIAQIDN